MIPYNVELFSPDFEYRASAQVEYIDHEYDYLDITKAAVKIPFFKQKTAYEMPK